MNIDRKYNIFLMGWHCHIAACIIYFVSSIYCEARKGLKRWRSFFICIALIKSNFRDGLVKIYKEKIRAELLEKQICFRRHGVKGKKTIGRGTFLDSFTENKRFYWTPGRLVPFFFVIILRKLLFCERRYETSFIYQIKPYSVFGRTLY